ncbi:MAG: UbiA prenyltransferase family protein [bacterium]
MMPAWLRLCRPHQWSKNLVCFAGVLFGGELENWRLFLPAAGAFLVFCAGSSAVYVLNDILDRERDGLHPKKKGRPIPSGAIGLPAAAALGLVLALAATGGAWWMGWATLTLLGLYLANGVLYSLWFKHVLLVDVQSIALGFALRLLAGIFAVGVPPTGWVIMSVFFLANFLGFSKRRAELAMANRQAAEQRAVLGQYTLPFLDGLVVSSSSMTVICYALFTLLSGNNPTLILTLPFVYYGVMRYKYLLYVLGEGEEPDVLLLHDRPIQGAIVLWLGAFLAISRWAPPLF